MMLLDRIQAWIYKMENAEGARCLKYAALALIVVVLAARYDTHCYRNFKAPEAMDAAQVGRNLAQGKGFSTEYLRPFSIYLLQRHNGMPNLAASAGEVDFGEVRRPHPDLANAPVYPVILAGLMTATSPRMDTGMAGKTGQFRMYRTELMIALFNQFLLLVLVWQTFMIARTVLDKPAAWLAAILVLCSDELWQLSVSGLPTLLLMVIFLQVAWSLVAFEAVNRTEHPASGERFQLAALAGFLTGVGMLTRYSFGWFIMPVLAFVVTFGGVRKLGLGVTALLAFAVATVPWLARNILVSGTFFGTAGYALMENSLFFPGSYLRQSLQPVMTLADGHMVYLLENKLLTNLRPVLESDLLHLGGGLVGAMFLAGLLLRLRSPAARRLRFFAVACLIVAVIVTALGRTALSTLSPDFNTENPMLWLMPLAVVFGLAFFLTLLDQMNLPFPEMRYIVIVLVIVLVRLPLALTLLSPRASPSAYPPYYPPDIQKIASWMEPNELLMSDIPWAVAWYGDRQCVETTVNCKEDFTVLNTYVKPVNGLYLSLGTLDGRLESDCIYGGDSWGHFGYGVLSFHSAPDFPLQDSPVDTILSGLFMADRRRW